MSLPSSYNTREVHGKWVDFDGNPAKGAVIFKPSVERITVGTTSILSGPVRAHLDENGEINVSLPATDDPDVSPVGFTYRVIENIAQREVKAYSVSVPLDPSPLELATAQTAEPVTPNTDTQYVNVSGDTMTGPLEIDAPEPGLTLNARNGWAHVAFVGTDVSGPSWFLRQGSSGLEFEHDFDLKFGIQEDYIIIPRDVELYTGTRVQVGRFGQGGDAGVIQFADGNVPDPPSSGGILYVEAGALKYASENGTVTEIGPA